jgi:hypothetical protein
VNQPFGAVSLMVGQPVSTGYTFFLMFEIERLETVVEMIQRLREPVDGVRMDTYARFEARVGRPRAARRRWLAGAGSGRLAG